MKIAPIDIAHKDFRKKAFGYDPEEVIEFLREVADEMEDVIRERNTLKEQVREKELSILEYRDRDKVLKDTIITAQKMSEKVRLDSEREGKLIVSDANHKAEMIVKDARDSLKNVYQEITDIKRVKIQFECHLKALCNTHLKLIEQSNDVIPSLNIPSIKTQSAAKTAVSPVSSSNI